MPYIVVISGSRECCWPLQLNLLEHSCAISLGVGFVLILSDTLMLGFKPVKEYHQTIP